MKIVGAGRILMEDGILPIGMILSKRNGASFRKVAKGRRRILIVTSDAGTMDLIPVSIADRPARDALNPDSMGE
jgi:hypothetical protein